jgi:FkbM family methyltransferase
MKMIKKLIPEILKSPIRSYLHSRRVYRSQAGQDFWVFGEVFDEMREGFFLDIGAHDGVELSNSYILEKRYNWSGICIEANPESFEQLKRNRRAICVNACLDASEGFVNFAKRGMFGGIISVKTDNKSVDSQSDINAMKTVTLEQLLKDIKAPNEIDYLSIDIEGAEERVLKGFPFKEYKFKCITIERPTDVLKDILKDNGYVLIKEIPGLDCFYLHHDFMDQYRSNVFSFYRKKYLAVCMG